MDKKTITRVVEKFNDAYFKDVNQVVEDNFDFFDEYCTYSTRVNYFFTYKYLIFVYNQFTRIDVDFKSWTLEKLKRDIESLKKLFIEHEKVKSNLQDIFQKKFILKSKLFSYMLKELELLEETKEENVEEIQNLKRHLKELREVYFSIFEEDFLVQNRYVLQDLKEILNRKIFYFDKLLWMDAKESPTINRKIINLEKRGESNSKVYLKEILKITLPYSENYQYFEKCLKVYK